MRIAIQHLLWACLLVFSACEQVEIPGQPNNPKPDTLVQPPPVTDYITVAQARALYETDETGKRWVAGYIVGVVEGTTMKQAKITKQTDKASNLLIADSPDETNAATCLPVELKAKSSIRNALNLADNPEVWGTRVAIYGNLTTYFRVAGLKSTSDYQAIASEDPPADLTGIKKPPLMD